MKLLFYGLLFYFLSLLSKEYAVSLIFFIPLLWYLTGVKKPVDALVATIPYLGVFCLYFILRINAIGFHINVICYGQVFKIAAPPLPAFLRLFLLPNYL
jgi:hypothetical protein